jgi:uncharacterized cupin superfamily protein
MSRSLPLPRHVVIANPATVELSPSPFPAEWVLDGTPQAQATAMAHSQDGAMTVIAWSCTKGRFRWHYQVDEAAHILAGEAFITDQSGTERRLGPGDTAFFAAGTSNVWLITQDIRKVAVCHVAVPKVVGLGLRIWNRLCRITPEAFGLDAVRAASNGGPAAEERARMPQSHRAAAAPPA